MDMPLLSSTQAAFAAVLVILIIGIMTEKNSVAWANVFGNVLSMIILLGIIELSMLMMAGLILYLALGLLAIYFKLKPLYTLFGYKTYGSLSLVILLASQEVFGLTLDTQTQESFQLFVLYWAAIALVVHLISYMHAPKKRKKKKKK